MTPPDWLVEIRPAGPSTVMVEVRHGGRLTRRLLGDLGMLRYGLPEARGFQLLLDELVDGDLRRAS